MSLHSRKGDPQVTRRSLPGDPKDAQARYIEAAVEDILVGCLYLRGGSDFDSREPKVRVSKPHDMYEPDLHIDSLKIRARNFR